MANANSIQKAGATPATDQLVIDSALSDWVYHRAVNDQAFSIAEISDDLKLIDIKTVHLELGQQLADSGFKIGADGFIYNVADGFTAAVVQSKSTGVYTIVYRGTDAGDEGDSANRDQKDYDQNGALGLGTLRSPNQARDALNLAGIILDIANREGHAVRVTGQSLGGGLAGLVAATESLSANLFAPAPFRIELNAIAIQKALSMRGATIDNLSDFGTLTNQMSAELPSFLNGFQNTVGAAVRNNYGEQAYIDFKSTYDGIVGGYSAFINSQNISVYRNLGETLTTGEFYPTVSLQFKAAAQEFDFGGNSSTAARGWLHTQALSALEIRSLKETGASPGEFAKLALNDAVLRDALIGDTVAVLGPTGGARSDDPTIDTSSRVGAYGPDPGIVERALWKTIGDDNGLYAYFWKAFSPQDGLLEFGAAAAGGNDLTKPTIHSGIVRLALSALRDAVAGTSTIDEVNARPAHNFIGGSDGNPLTDKVIVHLGDIQATDSRENDANHAPLGENDLNHVVWNKLVDALGSSSAVEAAIGLTYEDVFGYLTSEGGPDRLGWQVAVVQAGSDDGVLNYDPAGTGSGARPGDASLSHLVIGGTGNDTIKGSSAGDYILGGGGNDTLDGGGGRDIILGEAGDDTFVGGRGDTYLFGGADHDTVDYSAAKTATAGATLSIKNLQLDHKSGLEIHVPQQIGEHIDRLFDIETIKLTDKCDVVRPGGSAITPIGMNLLIDGDAADAPASGPGDTLDFSGSDTAIHIQSVQPDAVDLDTTDGKPTGLRFTNFESVVGSSKDDVLKLWSLNPGGALTAQQEAAWQAAKGIVVAFSSGDPATIGALMDARTAQARLIPQNQIAVSIDGGAGNDTILGTRTGADTIDGGAGNDVLEAGGFTSVLRGGAGDDWLIGGGFKSQLYGGAGNDVFQLTNDSFVMDAEAGDRVTWGGFSLSGGVQQSWMENGWAYWSPFTSIITGAGLFTAAAAGPVELLGAVLLDAVFLTTVRYAVTNTNQLVIQFARGRAGQAVIENYDPALDTDGHPTGGITVFKQDHLPPGQGSVANFENYINLALRAGFGVCAQGTDPLVLDLAGNGLNLTRRDNGTWFDVDHTGFAKKTAWVGAGNAFLARDLNGNGTIDDITELFGNATQSGFTALAELDGKSDQTIDAADAAFGSLRVRRYASGAIREFPPMCECELPTSARSSGTRAPSMLYA